MPKGLAPQQTNYQRLVEATARYLVAEYSAVMPVAYYKTVDLVVGLLDGREARFPVPVLLWPQIAPERS